MGGEQYKIHIQPPKYKHKYIYTVPKYLADRYLTQNETNLINKFRQIASDTALLVVPPGGNNKSKRVI